jgi:APA family basic amino acid/polyamine antiporter
MTETGRTRLSPHVFGFWTCVALVVGNMIGSGFYLLPATLAPFGWNAVFGWLITIAGALSLAAVFGTLARAIPRAGGPYAYSKQAFGPFVGFLVAWSYYVSLPVGNAAIAIGAIAPLSTFFRPVADHPAVATALLVWLLTAVNCIDARVAGWVQIVTATIKFLPLIAVLILAIYVLGGPVTLPPLRSQDLHLGSETGILAAGTITLWAFLGLESATVPAEKVVNAGPTIFRATMIGTAAVGLAYLFASSAVTLLLPPDALAQSGAPLADFVRPYWGRGAATLIAVAAFISAFGALNGWILLQGEMPWALARDGMFPAWLKPTSRGGTPVRAHLASSLLLTVLLAMNYTKGLTDLFKFLILLATLASLVAYLVCALATLVLHRRTRLAGPWLVPVTLLACLYSAWAIWGSGTESLIWGFILLLSGLPIYALNRVRTAAPWIIWRCW